MCHEEVVAVVPNIVPTYFLIAVLCLSSTYFVAIIVVGLYLQFGFHSDGLFP